MRKQSSLNSKEDSLNCSICLKHRDFELVTGAVIAQLHGVTMTHFPVGDDNLPTRAHLLIEPQRHIIDLSDLKDDEAVALGLLIQKGVRVLKAELGVEHVYAFRINDKTAHVHFHLIPRYADTPKEYWGLKIMEYPNRQKIHIGEVKELSVALKSAVDLL